MDESPEPATTGRSSWGRVAVTVVAALGILVVTVLTVGLIWLTEPEVQREGAVRKTAMLVETARAERGTFRPTLHALGSVRPFEEITLQPRVSGQLVEVDEAFVPGRVVDAGDLLMRIDPADARNALVLRRSALQQAEADLTLERGRQSVAKLERDQIARQLEGGINADQEALIIREPQLRSAAAAVESARASLRQAELELERTRVVAPFRGLVLERTAHTGSLVTPATGLGRLVGVDRFWVELTLPANQLRHLADDPALDVVLRDPVAWGPEQERTGTLESVIGQVDEQTRLARVLVSVSDPLGLDDATDGPAMMSGAWVEAELPGRLLTDVVRIDRSWLRRHQGRDAVWQMIDGKLRIHEVTVLIEDPGHAYLAGLTTDDPLVTTDLSTVTDGAPLRTTTESAR